MASDAFTNTNNTPLSSHTASGNTWAGCGQADASGEIQSNQACADGDDFMFVSARATNSSADFSQVVFKGGGYANESKTVNVRSSASTGGYYMQVYEVTGDNITTVLLRKGDGFLSGFSLSISRLIDHTVALKATAVAGGVELRGYIDGTQVTWNETSASNSSPSQVYTDLTAESPLPAGNPGFSCGYFDGIGPTSSAFDDWTDTESSGLSGSLAATESGTDTYAATGNLGNNGLRLTLRDTDTGALAANLTSLIVSVRANSNSGAVLLSVTNETTNASGILEIASLAIGNIGDYVYVTVEKSDHSIVAAYRVQVIDLNA